MESKEQLKILVCVNVLTSVDCVIYNNHCHIWYQWGKNHPNWEFIFYTPRRLPIDHARNEAARVALEAECDYLLFWDDDILVQSNALELLLAAQRDVISALVFVRQPPFVPMFFKGTGKDEEGDIYLSCFDDYEEHIDADGIVECEALGCGFTLIKVDLFKRLTKPWFVTSIHGAAHTEDVYFCVKAKKELAATMAVNTRIQTGHLLDKEALTSDNVVKLREFYKIEEDKFKGDFDPEQIRKDIANVEAKSR